MYSLFIKTADNQFDLLKEDLDIRKIFDYISKKEDFNNIIENSKEKQSLLDNLEKIKDINDMENKPDLSLLKAARHLHSCR